MAVQIKKATREELLARGAFIGVSGSGKTKSAIIAALIIAGMKGKRVGVIDTENRSASKYAGEKNPNVPSGELDFDVIELDSFHPDRYIEAIEAFEAAGYGAIVIDSLSHAWIGKDGVLEIKENAAKKRGNNDFTAWREASPHHNRLVEKLVRCTTHLFVCMRAKAEYAVTTNEVTKKTEIQKMGIQAEQRGGLEYEFDVVFDIDLKHFATASKTRCPDLDGKSFDMVRESKKVAEIYAGWLSLGTPRVAPPPFDAAPWHSRIAASSTIADLEQTGRDLGAALAHADETTKARLRAAYDERAMALATPPTAGAVPERTFETPSTTTPAPTPDATLTPGNDPPSMAATTTQAPAPAAEKSPREKACDEILAAFDKVKTDADLGRLVAPLIEKHRPRLTKADLDQARTMWNEIAAAIVKAGGKLP